MAADTNTWATNPYTWAVSTYSATANLNADSSLSFSQTAAFPVTANMTQVIFSELNEEDAVFPRSITIGMATGMTGIAAVAIPVTATFATNETFSNSGLALMPMSITLSGTSTATNTGNTIYPEVVTLSSDNGFSLAEDMLIPVDVTLGISNDINGTNNAIYVESLTIANEQGIKFNINFEESASFDINSSISSINNFLWNDEAEDTGTTWTKVSDPDE